MRFAVLFLPGVLLGAAAAGFGIWLGSGSAGAIDDPSVTITTVTSTTVADEPVWDTAGEVRFESTLLIPGTLNVAGGTARLPYELRSIAQDYPTTFIPYPAALPATWLLTTRDGTEITAETGPPNVPTSFGEGGPPPLRHSVAFEVSEDLEGSDIAAITITSWRVAAPMEIRVSLPVSSGASFEMLDGSVVTLRTVLEQRTGTIIAFDIESDFDPWHGTGDSQPFGPNETFRPIGEGWLETSGSFGGGFQLTWGGGTVPDEITMVVATTEWIPVDGERAVTPEAVDG